jgi:hypothetical protein
MVVSTTERRAELQDQMYRSARAMASKPGYPLARGALARPSHLVYGAGRLKLR